MCLNFVFHIQTWRHTTNNIHDKQHADYFTSITVSAGFNHGEVNRTFICPSSPAAWGTENQSSCTWIAPDDTYLNGDGSLVLRSRTGSFPAPSGTVFSYTSGWVWLKTWHTYGYIEIRASYPNHRGAWPAFWMLQDGWPPEIDIAEYRGNPKNYMTQAFYDGSWYSNTVDRDYTEWHTYALEWSEDSLKYYIDDDLVYTHTGNSVPSNDMYVILSNGTDCGDTDGSGFPNYFNIDYFRWYQLQK